MITIKNLILALICLVFVLNLKSEDRYKVPEEIKKQVVKITGRKIK